MATIDKSKSQTYDFLSKNKSIEDIKQQPNIFVKEIKNKRHGGKTFRIDNANNRRVNHDLSKNNRENLEPVTSNLINNEKEQEINNDVWTKFKNLLPTSISNIQEISKLQTIIQENKKEIQQLKNENEKLKQCDINLTKYSYNAITIYDEKRIKKTGIDKIHEEILPINNQIYFITTFVHINESISEEILCFQQFQNGDIEIMKQLKKYENLNGYKNDLLLIEEDSNHDKNIKIEPLSIKNFLNQQMLENLKPTKNEKWIWIISVVLPTIALIIGIFHPPALIVGGIGLTFKTCTSILSSATRKVDAWFGNKFYKSKDQKDKEKKERQSIIKNLINDKLETKLQTQYEILKQELDNRKNKNPDQLMINNTINHNSNNLLENSSIESENNHNFDSDIKNTVNNQSPQSSTSSNHNWNKVKCLFT